MSEQLETITRKQFWRLPEFSRLSRSGMYHRYREMLALSGYPNPTRYTQLKITDLSRLANLSEAHIRRHISVTKSPKSPEKS